MAEEQGEEGVIHKRLQKSIKFLTDSQFLLCTKLCRLGQEHLFEPWDAMSPAGRRRLAEQLEAIDQEYPDGGIEGYMKNARELLNKSREGVNPLDGWIPEVPVGETFDMCSDAFFETEEKGLKELGSVGFVLVAGGLGERLGYNKIKIGLPTELTTETRYIHYYIEYILAAQKKYAPVGRELPLCIMTSGDTHEQTVTILKFNKYFGMKESQVTIVQQGQGVPALTDNEANLCLVDGEDSCLLTKPHGHGDIHSLLHKHGVARKWKEQGIKWCCLFQDTNGLAFHALPLMLGVSAKKNLIMNSLAVPRKAKQAIGGIAKLKHKSTGEYKTINVEYNQLDPMLRASGFKDGDVNDEKTGFSPFPGNINQLLFKIDEYCDALEKSKGLMPEFVNPKYKDSKKTIFKKPTRLECMMQDFPSVLDWKEALRVGFTSISSDFCFSPVKNATDDGVALQEKGTAPGTAATGEADQYGAVRKIMQKIGCQIEDAPEESHLGIKVVLGPAIVLKPNFALCATEIRQKFPNPDKIKISHRSTLVIRGEQVAVHSLDLDGTLLVDVPSGEVCVVDGLQVNNEGWIRVPDIMNEKEFIMMRGYRIVRRAQTIVRGNVSETNNANDEIPKIMSMQSFEHTDPEGKKDENAECCIL